MPKKWDMNLIKKPINPNSYKIDGCFVDEEERFAFIHIYKNASISLRNALKMRGRYFTFTEKQNSLIKICIIRNPIERVVSSYLYLLRLEHNGFPHKHPTHLTEKAEFYLTRHRPVRSFLSFVEAIKDGNFYDAVTLPQIEFIRHRGLSINDIEEVMIQENICKDFDKFSSKYRIAASFPKDNTSSPKISQLLNNYISHSPDLRKAIIDLYREDVVLYNDLVEKRIEDVERIQQLAIR